MSKYQPLADHLTACRLDRLQMTFREIEAVLGFSLPASARKHTAWWANEVSGTHTHSRSWQRVGYETVELDQARGRLTFRRRRN